MGCCISSSSDADTSHGGRGGVDNGSIPLHGISQKYLRSLVSKHGAETWAVSDFCDKVVKPLTAESRSSLAIELLSSDETKQHVTKKADVFVSYAWKYSMGDVLDCLEEGLGEDKDRFIWLDVATINQHTSTEVDQATWLQTFSSALKDIGKAEIILVPWQKPIPVSRSWCVFEQYVITSQGIPFKARMRPRDQDEVRMKLRKGAIYYSHFLDTFAGIDCEKSTAFKLNDQERILNVIRSNRAVKATNDATMLSVKTFLLDVALDEAKHAETEDQSAGVCNVFHEVGILYDALGDAEIAVQWYLKGLEARRKFFNNQDHEDIASSLNDLSACLIKLDRFDDAEPYVKECLAMKERVLGANNADTIKVRGIVGTLLLKRNRFAEALPVLESVVEQTKQTLGDEHENVALAMNNLGSCLKHVGRNEEAIATLEQALKITTKRLGNSHPDIVSQLNNLATCYDALGQSQKAAECYEKAVTIAKTTLGDDHRLVGTALHNLAMTLADMGENDRAQVMGKQAVAIFKKRLGPKNPNTLMLIEMWGNPD